MTVRGPLSFHPVEGHRRYADEPEPSWYSGQDQYSSSATKPYDSGVHERPSGAFRLPEQREGDLAASLPYVTPDPVISTGSHSRSSSDPSPDQVRIPVRGPEYPTIRPTGATSLADTPPATYGGATSLADTPPATYGGATSLADAPPPAYGSVTSLADASPPAYGSATSLADVSPSTTYGGGSATAAGTYGGASSAPATTYGTGQSAPVSAPGATPVPSSPAGGVVTPHPEPTGVVPPVSRFATETKPAEAVYRSRRPVSAVVVAVATVLLMVPVVMLLIQATFVDDPVARGIVPAVLLTLGLPLTGVGLYALAGGGPVGREALMRPPVVYLPVGLVLLLAAGLSVA